MLRRPFFGYRRITAQLRREGRPVNTQAVRRILKELGVHRQVGQVRIRTTDSSHPHWRYPNLFAGWQLKQPDQVWVADVTYIRLGSSFVFLAVILDAYSRAVRGWALRRDLTKELTLSALRMALQHGTRLFIILTRAYSTPPLTTLTYCWKTMFVSAWPILANRRRMG